MSGERDWPEDAAHENGNYSCRCISCGNEFTGHKRRVTCAVCAKAEPPIDLAEGRRLLERATGGTWSLFVPDRGHLSNYIITDDPALVPTAIEPHRNLIVDCDTVRGEDDAAAIIWLLNNAPALLSSEARAQAAEAELKAAENCLLRGDCPPAEFAAWLRLSKAENDALLRAERAEAERDALKAEVERLMVLLNSPETADFVKSLTPNPPSSACTPATPPPDRPASPR